MVNQTTVKMNGPERARVGSTVPDSGAEPVTSADADSGQMVSNVAGFGENLLTLGELQARLAAVELKQNLEAARISAPVLTTGVALALTSLPIALAGIAELLVAELEMRRGIALLIVALVAFAVAGTCLAIGGVQLRRTVTGFPLSGEELTRNLHWVRTVLTHSGRSER
jgi:hypothetical protein